jgi:uncharacterized integral membrane protein
VAEPETSQSAAPTDRAGKKPWEGSGPAGFSWKAIILAALGIYALLLIIQNSKTVSVDFVFVSQQTRLIYLVLLSMALGALIMWLVPRMRRRRKARRSAAGSDRAGKRSWEGSGPAGFSWKAIILAALGIYALLLIIFNSKTVSVDFVFVSQQTRLIYLVLLSMALGALIMWLVPRMRHRRKVKQSASASRPRKEIPASGADIDAAG